MQTKVFDMAGKQVGEIELSDAIFGIEPNAAVVHDVVKNHLANCRQGNTCRTDAAQAGRTAEYRTSYLCPDSSGDYG